MSCDKSLTRYQVFHPGNAARKLQRRQSYQRLHECVCDKRIDSILRKLLRVFLISIALCSSYFLVSAFYSATLRRFQQIRRIFHYRTTVFPVALLILDSGHQNVKKKHRLMSGERGERKTTNSFNFDANDVGLFVFMKPHKTNLFVNRT